MKTPASSLHSSGQAIKKQIVSANIAGQQEAFASLPSATETEHLSFVVGAIYDAALDPNLWPEALRLTASFLNGVAANLYWQDPVNHAAIVFHQWGLSKYSIDEYFRDFASINPLYPAFNFIPLGVVRSGGDIIPHEEFQQTRFYREWVAKNGFIDVVGVNLHRFAIGVATLAFQRSRAQGYVDDEMRRKLGLLVPHVHRALMIGREFDQHRARSGDLGAVLDSVTAGVFLVDASGRLDFVNEAGSALLRSGDMLRRKDGCLSASDRAADRALRAAFVAAAASDDLSLHEGRPSIALADDRGEHYLAHVLPLASGARQKASLGFCASAAVFVRKAEIPIVSGIETMAKLHRLTPGEIRVLQAVTGDGSAAEIALALGLAVSTVKTHLKALFEKTGTRRRSDLIKAVAAHGNPLL